jgi:succinoglycan biosynthesis transport protein ExoP
MTTAPVYTASPADALRTLCRHPWHWLAPAAAVMFLAAVYALVRPVTWEASQALIVRDEAIAGPARPGRFQHVEDMRTVQETILELAKSRTVAAAALQQVGPPEDRDAAPAWPTPSDIAALQGAIRLTPPKGAEFGKTEVFYLKVQDRNRQRALALAEALCAQLQARFRDLRNAKAASITAELSRSVELAQQDLNLATASLAELENEVGADLAELRSLQDHAAADGPARLMIAEMEAELRQHRAAASANAELLALLQASKSDHGFLLAAPNRLLESQPSLRRLKDGLVDAQLRSAQLQGSMLPEHPQVVATQASEAEVREHVRQELDSAMRGVEVEQRLSAERCAAIETQLAQARQRLQRLAAMRAQYANLAAAVQHRSEILKSAQQQLTEARANEDAARSASLITPVDGPDAGQRPVGPGRAMIVAAGMAGGLLIGLGVVFLTVSPVPPGAQAADVAALTARSPPALGQGAAASVAAPPPSQNGGLSVNRDRDAIDSDGSVLSLKEALRRVAAL